MIQTQTTAPPDDSREKRTVSGGRVTFPGSGVGGPAREGSGGVRGVRDQGPPTARGQRSAGEGVLTTDARGGKEIRKQHAVEGKRPTGRSGDGTGRRSLMLGLGMDPPRTAQGPSGVWVLAGVPGGATPPRSFWSTSSRYQSSSASRRSSRACSFAIRYSRRRAASDNVMG